MKGITRKMLFGCLTILIILTLSSYVHAQKSKGVKNVVPAMESILKRLEVCHDQLSRCCNSPDEYCEYDDCKTELTNCHRLPYGDFLVMANHPYNGVTLTRDDVAGAIDTLDCEADGVRISVNESTNLVSITRRDKDVAHACYSVAFMRAIVDLNPETVTFYEGRYADSGYDAVPFKLHFPSTLSIDDQYYNLSDTEGDCYSLRAAR